MKEVLMKILVGKEDEIDWAISAIEKWVNKMTEFDEIVLDWFIESVLM